MDKNESSDSSEEGLISDSVVEGRFPFRPKSLEFGSVVIQAVADGNNPS